MTGNNLDACLKQFSLEKYLSNFKSRGINGRKELVSLTMQDYPSLGITSMKDREKLFHLIQNLKAAEENEKSKTSRQNEVKGDKNKLSCKVPTEQRESTDKYKSNSKKRSTGSVSQSPAIANTESPHKPTKCASVSRSKSDIVTVEDGYNYGVPSSKPKLSLAKKSSALPTEARIRVCVRKRPLSVEERQTGEFDIVEVTGTDVVTVYAPKVSVDLSKYTQTYPFVFDEAFDEYCTNEDVYTRTAQPLVKTVFNGGKATCFCYGCTGSGKTYTMLGNDTVQGLYLLATKDIFSTLQSQIGKASLWVSFFEIYCGQLFDLLNGRTKLHARENASHQVCINGLTEQEVLNVEQLMDLIDYGNTVRSTGSTGVNADSSRSHAILQLEVKTDGGTKPAGRFSFIDLAGSERAADVTDTDRQTRMEGAEINQSLLALKECIRALDQDSKHTPFRQSKLTQVLKDSFVGDSHTCMIANISPNMSSSENTLNTLRYADRAKELRRMDVQSPRPATAAKTDFNFWSEEKIMNTKSNKNLPKLKIEEIKKETHSRDLSKALEKINMSDFEKLGNIRPNTTSDLDSQQTTSIAAGRIARVQTLKVPKLCKGAGLSQSYNLGTTPLNQLTTTARPVTSPAVTPSKSKGGAKRLLKPHSRNTVMKRNNYLLPSANIKRNKDVILEEVNMKAEKERESGNSQFVFSKVSETEVKVPLASNNLSMMSKSKLTPSKGTSGRELNQLSLNTKPSNVLGKSSSSTSNVAETLPPKPDEVSPPLPNTRYNNRSFKARLSRLFNSKSSELAPPATGNTKGPIAKSKPDLEEIKVPHSLHDITRMKTYPLLTREHEHLTLTQEQIIAAHHTQLALTTGLCQEEMVLLRKVDSKDQSFSDYINQLEDILLQKATSIDTLRRKLASYSKR